MSGDIGLNYLRSVIGGTKLVVVATMDKRNARKCARRVNADLFLSKYEPREELARQLQAVVATIGPPRDDSAGAGSISPIRPHPDRFGHQLTSRQRDVLALLAHGKTNREISSALAISEGTVKAHMNSAFRILGVQNRMSAVAAFSRYSFDDDEDDGDENEAVLL